MFPVFVRAAVLTVATVVASGMVTAASAATFNVSPTQIYLNGGTSSALLTLRNDSAEPLRFQISAFAWDQQPSGEMALTPTEDVVFFPALLTLKPGEERKIRVGRVVAVAPVERTYRIFVEELPPLEAVTDGAASVKVLTKMGIPVFVRPAKEATSAQISDLQARDGAVRFALANAGTVHFVPERVTVKGLGEGGPVFEEQLQAWYVLAGGRREFEVMLPETCNRATALQVEVALNGSTINERVDVPAGACK